MRPRAARSPTFSRPRRARLRPGPQAAQSLGKLRYASPVMIQREHTAPACAEPPDAVGFLAPCPLPFLFPLQLPRPAPRALPAPRAPRLAPRLLRPRSNVTLCVFCVHQEKATPQCFTSPGSPPYVRNLPSLAHAPTLADHTRECCGYPPCWIPAAQTTLSGLATLTHQANSCPGAALQSQLNTRNTTYSPTCRSLSSRVALVRGAFPRAWPAPRGLDWA